MFGTIRRHQKWLWFVIAGLTIISFVIFGPTNQRLGSALSGANSAMVGNINGRPINQDEFFKAEHEVELDYFLSNGQWPDDASAKNSNFDVTRETYFRLLLIEKQKELNVQVNTETVTAFARQVLAAFRAASAEDFERLVLKPRGLDMGDLDRCLRRKVAVQEMVAVYGLGGKMVTPQEAEELYRKEHRELNTAIAFFSASNYLASVTVTPEMLSQFYSNRMDSYTVPNRVQVDYVKYNVTNYLAEAKSQLTNLDAVVESEYQRYGTNAALLAKTPEEARAKIREQVIRVRGLGLAARAANLFAVDVDNATPRDASNLAALAAKRGLTHGTSEPFDEQDGPKGWGLPQKAVKKAFQLSPDDPFTGAMVGEDGAYVLAYKLKLPSQVPTLKEVEDKVREDFRLIVSAQTARQAGSAMASSLTNGLPAGKSFAGVAAAAQVKSETLPPFSLSTQSLPPEVEDRISLRMLKNVAFNTPVGKASPFVPTQEGGFILYVQSETPVAETLLKKELPEFTEYVRQARQGDAFNLWFNNQIQQDQGLMQVLRKHAEDAAQSAGRKPAS